MGLRHTKPSVLRDFTWHLKLSQTHLVDPSSYLEGHGDIVSRFITPIRHIITPIIRITILLNPRTNLIKGTIFKEENWENCLVKDSFQLGGILSGEKGLDLKNLFGVPILIVELRK